MCKPNVLSVLIVDDSLMAIKNISHQIELTGHNVIGTAMSAPDAVQKYKALRPDLVTMDITMPEIDGIVAVKNIISLDKNADIIMVTSHGQENLVAQALLVGAKGYILKPLTEEKLIETIEMIKNSYQDTENDDLL